MFIKVTTSGGHRYARLVESFRNEEGQPRQRTVASRPCKTSATRMNIGFAPVPLCA